MFIAAWLTIAKTWGQPKCLSTQESVTKLRWVHTAGYRFSVCLAAKLCLTPLWPPGLQPASLLCLWHFPGKNTGMSCCFPLQGIFPTRRSNPRLLHWQEFFTTEPPGEPPMEDYLAIKGMKQCHLQRRGWTLRLLHRVKEVRKRKQIPYNIAFMWNLEKWWRWTYLQSRIRVTVIENKLMVPQRDVNGKLLLTYIRYHV